MSKQSLLFLFMISYFLLVMHYSRRVEHEERNIQVIRYHIRFDVLLSKFHPRSIQPVRAEGKRQFARIGQPLMYSLCMYIDLPSFFKRRNNLFFYETHTHRHILYDLYIYDKKEKENRG